MGFDSICRVAADQPHLYYIVMTFCDSNCNGVTKLTPQKVKFKSLIHGTQNLKAGI